VELFDSKSLTKLLTTQEVNLKRYLPAPLILSIMLQLKHST